MAGKPILAHILDEVGALGIRNIVLVVGYRADQIVTFVKENYAMDSDGTIGVRKVEDPRRFGVVQMEGDQIVGLVEKPETFHRVVRNYLIGLEEDIPGVTRS